MTIQEFLDYVEDFQIPHDYQIIVNEPNQWGCPLERITDLEFNNEFKQICINLDGCGT